MARPSVEKRIAKSNFVSEAKWLGIQLALALTMALMMLCIFTTCEINIVAYMLLGATILYFCGVVKNTKKVIDLYKKI